MDISKVKSKVNSKIKSYYAKLLFYDLVTTFIPISLFVILAMFQIINNLKLFPNNSYNLSLSFVAAMLITILLLILSPAPYTYAKMCLDIANDKTTPKDLNPFKIKLGKGIYRKIVSTNLFGSIPAALSLIHTLLFLISLFISFLSSKSSFAMNQIILIISVIIMLTYPITVIITSRNQYSYLFAPYILIQNPDIEPRMAIKECKKLLKNDRKEYSKLYSSYLSLPIIISSLGYFFIFTDVFSRNTQTSDAAIYNNSIALVLIVALVTTLCNPFVNLANAEFYKQLKENEEKNLD